MLGGRQRLRHPRVGEVVQVGLCDPGQPHPPPGHRHHRPLGTTHYGRLSGLLGARAHAAAALAPFTGAVMAGPLGGYAALCAPLVALSATAAVTALGTRPVNGPGG